MPVNHDPTRPALSVGRSPWRPPEPHGQPRQGWASPPELHASNACPMCGESFPSPADARDPDLWERSPVGAGAASPTTEPPSGRFADTGRIRAQEELPPLDPPPFHDFPRPAFPGLGAAGKETGLEILPVLSKRLVGRIRDELLGLGGALRVRGAATARALGVSESKWTREVMKAERVEKALEDLLITFTWIAETQNPSFPELQKLEAAISKVRRCKALPERILDYLPPFTLPNQPGAPDRPPMPQYVWDAYIRAGYALQGR